MKYFLKTGRVGRSFVARAIVLTGTCALSITNGAADEPNREEAATTARRQSTEISNWTYQIEAAKKASDSSRQSYATYQLLTAYSKCAEAHELLQAWEKAEQDWNRAGELGKQYNSAIGTGNKVSVASYYVGAANAQYKQREYSQAAGSLAQARGAEGWEYINIRGHLLTQRVSIHMERYDIVLSTGADFRRALQNFRVQAKAPNLYDGMEITSIRLDAIAYYLKGDMDSALQRWAQAAVVAKTDPNKHPFDPEQLKFNLAVAQNPKDATARLIRARYLVARGDHAVQVRDGVTTTDDFLDRVIDSKAAPKQLDAPVNTGGITNLMDLEGPTSAAFYASAIHDANQGLKNAAEASLTSTIPAGLYLTRAAARVGFNANTTANDKFNINQIYTDYAAASKALPRDPETLKIVGEFFAGEALRYTALKDAEGGSNMARNAIGMYSRAIYWDQAESFKRTLWEKRQRLVPLLKTGTLETPPPGEPKTAVQWKERGNAFNAASDWKNAFDCYTKSINADPKFADGYNNIGSIYNSIRHYDLAVEAFSRAITLDPKHKIAYYNRSASYKYLNEPEKAMSDSNKAVEYASTPAMKRDALVHRAGLKIDAEYEAAALMDLIAATDVNPAGDEGGAEAWNARGSLELQARDFAAADASLAKALELNLRQPRALLLRGLISHFQKSAKPTEIGQETRENITRPLPWLKADDVEWLGTYCQKLVRLPAFKEADAKVGNASYTLTVCQTYFDAVRYAFEHRV